MINFVLGACVLLAAVSYFRDWPWAKAPVHFGPWLLHELVLRYSMRYIYPILLAANIWFSFSFWGIVKMLDFELPVRAINGLFPSMNLGDYALLIGILLLVFGYIGLWGVARFIVSGKKDLKEKLGRIYAAQTRRSTLFFYAFRVVFEFVLIVAFSLNTILAISFIIVSIYWC